MYRATSKPLVFAELACCSSKPRVVPAVEEGVAVRFRTFTLPAKSEVTFIFSVADSTASKSVLSVVRPFTVTVLAKVVASCTSKISAPLITMSLPAPVLAKVIAPVAVRLPMLTKSPSFSSLVVLLV